MLVTSLQSTLISSLNILIEIIVWAIFLRVILTWIMPAHRRGYNSFIQIVYAITEPILGPIRRLLDKSSMMNNLPIDFSPWIAMILLQSVIRSFFIYLITRLPF